MPRSDDQDLKFRTPTKQIKLWPWILVGSILLVLGMCTCGAGGVALYFYPRDPSPQFLLGTWRHEGWFQETVYEFRADGTGRLSRDRNWNEEFTYRLEGSRLTVDPRINDRQNPFRGVMGRQKLVWRSGPDLIMEDDDFLRNRMVLSRVR